MKIAVDIDDTLNVLERVRYAGEYIRRNDLPFRLKDPDANAFVDVYDWTMDDVLKFVHEGGGITAFTDAPVRKGAREALTRWKEEGHALEGGGAHRRHPHLAPAFVVFQSRKDLPRLAGKAAHPLR